MTARLTVRTMATLVTALGVVTMFTGSAVAVGLGPVGVAEEDGDAVVDVELDTDAGETGSGGSGTVAVDSAQGGAEGTGAVAGDVEEQSLNVTAAGEGGPAGEASNGSVSCEISPDSVRNPQDVCDYEAPGGGENPIPDAPGDELPDGELPGDDLPELPDEEPPELPGDGGPELPGGDLPELPDDLPVQPGGQLPIDGLQGL